MNKVKISKEFIRLKAQIMRHNRNKVKYRLHPKIWNKTPFDEKIMHLVIDNELGYEEILKIEYGGDEAKRLNNTGRTIKLDSQCYINRDKIRYILKTLTRAELDIIVNKLSIRLRNILVKILLLQREPKYKGIFENMNAYEKFITWHEEFDNNEPLEHLDMLILLQKHLLTTEVRVHLFLYGLDAIPYTKKEFEEEYPNYKGINPNLNLN